MRDGLGVLMMADAKITKPNIKTNIKSSNPVCIDTVNIVITKAYATVWKVCVPPCFTLLYTSDTIVPYNKKPIATNK